MSQRPTSRVHLFVLALCVSGSLAVALHPRRVSPEASAEVALEFLDMALGRLLGRVPPDGG